MSSITLNCIRKPLICAVAALSQNIYFVLPKQRLCETMELISNIDNRILSAAIAAIVSFAIALPNFIFLVIKYRNDGALVRNAEVFVIALLAASKDNTVAFRLIRHHIGGYSDDELRQLLVRSGAVRIADTNMIEYWVLFQSLKSKDREDLINFKVSARPPPPAHKLFPTPNASGTGKKDV